MESMGSRAKVARASNPVSPVRRRKGLRPQVSPAAPDLAERETGRRPHTPTPAGHGAPVDPADLPSRLLNRREIVYCWAAGHHWHEWIERCGAALHCPPLYVEALLLAVVTWPEHYEGVPVLPGCQGHNDEPCPGLRVYGHRLCPACEAIEAGEPEPAITPEPSVSTSGEAIRAMGEMVTHDAQGRPHAVELAEPDLLPDSEESLLAEIRLGVLAPADRDAYDRDVVRLQAEWDAELAGATDPAAAARRAALAPSPAE